MDASGGNIAGVTNEIPLSLQLQTALSLVPFKKLGLLFDPREKNSMLVREKLVEVARPLGLEVVDLRSPPAQNMLEDNLSKLRDRSIAVDAVYLPADSFIVSRSQLIGTELRAARIKSIGAIERYVDDGALLGLVPEYRDLGRAAATIVHRHQGGQKLAEMLVQSDRDPLLKINATTSRARQVEVPAALRKRARVVE
jgi:putative ABC transport system substrate-binding protein